MSQPVSRAVIGTQDGLAAFLADDLHERLAMQTGFDPELDDWGEWWRQQVTEALNAAVTRLA